MSKVDNYFFIKVFQREDLTAYEKLVLLCFIVEIGDDLINYHTYLTNEEISKKTGLSTRTITRVITSLKKKNIISLVSFNGKSRELKINVV